MRKRKSYKIGKGKPPKETQFQPGKSGNKKGRPKGSKNLSTAIRRELNNKVRVTENGRERNLRKVDIAAKRFVNKALEGDHKAFMAVSKLTEGEEHDAADAAHSLGFDTPGSALVIADICRRIRAMESTPQNDLALPLPTPQKKRKT